ncbi:MAG: carboxypeptidase regulatory-like domain-containing protein, partial [Myxococcales bacterium]|nr:carboxypeptidase regulatory-like domain-containing protein [Myxococcales bacterium]
RWRLKQAVDELRDRLDHREPNRAWLPALAAFAGPPRAASLAVPWLIFAAIALLIATAWLAVRAQPTGEDPATLGAAQRHVAARPISEHGDLASGEGTAVVASSTLRPLPSGKLRVTGRVEDLHRLPVEDADVVLDCAFDVAPGALPQTRSNARGEFSFIVDPGCQPSLLATKADRAASISAPGLPREGTVLVLQPKLEIIVRAVDDATGKPIAGAVVAAVGMFSSGNLDKRTAWTDTQGRATLRVVRNPFKGSPLRLTAHGRDHAVASLETTDEDPGRTMPIERTIRLARGLPLRGQVLVADAAMASGLELGVFSSDRITSENKPTFLLATGLDADGRFAIAVPRAGRYQLVPQSRRVDARDPRETIVEVGPDGRSDVLIHIVAKPVLVVGKVIDTAGTPVAGARISAPGQPMMLTAPFTPVVTDAHGRFEARHLGPTMDLVAHVGDLASGIMQVEVHNGQPGQLTMVVGPAGIAGVVVDPDGLPIADAQVWLNDCCGVDRPVVEGTRAITDATGRFVFDVPRGDFVLSVRRSADDDFLDEDDRRVAGGTHNVRLVVP